MMAPLAKIFGGIATVLVTLVLIGLVLPGTWSAEASIEIEADPTEVFPYLNDLMEIFFRWRRCLFIVGKDSAGWLPCLGQPAPGCFIRVGQPKFTLPG